MVDVLYYYRYTCYNNYNILKLFSTARSDNELVGYINSRMIYIENNKTWEIVDLKNNTLAFTNDTDELPVGLHSWYFLDVPCTDPGEALTRKLNLHQAVKQPGNFCCDNGACIRTVLERNKDFYKNNKIIKSTSGQGKCVTMSDIVMTILTSETVIWSDSLRPMTTCCLQQRDSKCQPGNWDLLMVSLLPSRPI